MQRLLGKHARQRFPIKKAWRASYPLQLVHFDICGPMLIASLGKNSYFLTFIDDYSRVYWAYFLKHKNEAFDCFKEFQNLVENQSGCSLKCLGTD